MAILKMGSKVSIYPIWHSGNDGEGSGLDADLLDGLDSLFFLTSKNIQFDNAVYSYLNANNVQDAIDELSMNKINERIIPSSYLLDKPEIRKNIINNYGQTEDVTLTLTYANVGASFIVILGTTVNKYFRLKARSGDKIYLDGIPGSNAGYVGVTSAVAGNAIAFMTFKTGDDNYDWYAMTMSGNWTAGT